jgi:hypothetical protein
MSSPPPPRRPPAWLRLHDDLIGIVAGVCTAYGSTVLTRGVVGPAGHTVDVLVLLGGMLGMCWTCIDMALNEHWRAQGRVESALVGGLAGLLALALAGIACAFGMLFAAIGLDSSLDLSVRSGSAMLAIYYFAIVLWLQRDSKP